LCCRAGSEGAGACAAGGETDAGTAGRAREDQAVETQAGDG